MSEQAQKLIFSSILMGAALPLAALTMSGSLTTSPLLPAGLAVITVATGLTLSRRWAKALSEKHHNDTQEQVRSAQDEMNRSVTQANALLKDKTKHLISLTDDHQLRATESTSAAARATENATIIASAIEEMNTAILEIGRQADEATTIAHEATQKAKTADVSASALSEKGDQILSIVELIRSIAARTNLLALNATIEAARAGEHGKGFAVVANEVKSLAKQTAEATTKIEFQINEVREASHNMKSQMAAIEKTVDQINAITQTIRTALSEETSAAHEISRSALETTTATDAVTAGISHMLVTTEELRRASTALADGLGAGAEQKAP